MLVYVRVMYLPIIPLLPSLLDKNFPTTRVDISISLFYLLSIYISIYSIYTAMYLTITSFSLQFIILGQFSRLGLGLQCSADSPLSCSTNLGYVFR